jgi:serine/threonine protein kinase
MGEVYRARDTKLDRDVALKVLPHAFTDDPDRLARFEREPHSPSPIRFSRSVKLSPSTIQRAGSAPFSGERRTLRSAGASV